MGLTKVQRRDFKGGSTRSAAPPRRPSRTRLYPAQRRLPVGAELLPAGGAHFRVWAPNSKSVAVEILAGTEKKNNGGTRRFELEAEGNGYFGASVAEARAGTLYRLVLDTGAFPDPASRFQPEGPHGPSQVVDPKGFKWTDRKWKGVRREGQVIYEMHIGTFTPEGTWVSAQERLAELAALGITVLEVMPVADFPGRFGWGYDGVNLFAPTRLYGKPDDFRAFVNRAHELGLGVILDVVYNHIGPDGNYLKQFAPHYFSERYKNEWGEALNFDDEQSGPVREFFISNAVYWIDEFHLDGLRLDATQQIFDSSKEHLLAAISRQTRAIAPDRKIYLAAENEEQDSELARGLERGGYGLDAIWNDDFHHAAMAAVTGRNEAYYSDYRGAPQEFISAMKRGFLYQGQWYSWQKKNRGKPALDLQPANFINFIQNHDQVANSLHGLRVHQLTSPGRFKAITAVLLLGPGTPLLFQGEEFAASTPFLYFADHNPELARLVAAGRKQFLHQFSTIACPEADPYVADPGEQNTFDRSKLDWSEREKNSAIYELHRDLLKLRRDDAVFSGAHRRGLDGAVLSSEAFVLRFFGDAENDRLLVVNLGLDLQLSAAPEPLLAPLQGHGWKVRWSTESPCYGGCGTLPLQEGNWKAPGHAAVVLEPVANNSKGDHG
jgi:maltooligosyltrehalose trehalohydrolase